MPDAEQVLAVRDLTVILSRNEQPVRILDNVSLDVAPGEVLALVGESGSGKSTIAAALQGLIPQESLRRVMGSVKISGEEVVGAPIATLRAVRKHLVRSVPQDPMSALNPTMSIRRQMAEAADGGSDLITERLAQAGLADPKQIVNSLPFMLSGGQCQRVLIAMAMMPAPRLLIADEPTTALDVTIQAQILKLIRQLATEQQTAVLFITHDLGVAATVADRVAVLYAGRVVEVGTTGEVLSTPTHPYTAALLAARYDLQSDRSRPLPTLPAQRGSTSSWDSSCAYAVRCPLAQADCRSARPALRSSADRSGQVACLHAEQTPMISESRTPLEPWPARSSEERALALSFESVRKSYPQRVGLLGCRRDRAVLRSIDLSIKFGECLALVGESGAGKSTILKIAARLVEPDGGQVSTPGGLPQILSQDPAATLTPWLTVGEQVGERLRSSATSKMDRSRLVAETFETVGLGSDLMHALPSELSIGQCQRVALARAIVVPPKLLLCDEPVSAMDVSLAAATLNLLQDVRAKLGIAMLFVTHDLAAARLIADRIAILRNGEIVEAIDAPSFVAKARSPYARSLIAAVPELSFAQAMS